jgi:hypothetical protein
VHKTRDGSVWDYGLDPSGDVGDDRWVDVVGLSVLGRCGRAGIREEVMVVIWIDADLDVGMIS